LKNTTNITEVLLSIDSFANAMSLASQKKYKDSLYHFGNALAFDPSLVNARYYFSVSLLKAGHNIQALFQINLCLGVKKTKDFAFQKVNCLVALNRFEEAYVLSGQLVTQYADDQVLSQLAYIYLLDGGYELAYKFMAESVKICSPELCLASAQYHLVMAECSQKMGKKPIKELENALLVYNHNGRINDAIKVTMMIKRIS
jgi:tetratricopeptide (TPR) repeat protein